MAKSSPMSKLPQRSTTTHAKKMETDSAQSTLAVPGPPCYYPWNSGLCSREKDPTIIYLINGMFSWPTSSGATTRPSANNIPPDTSAKGIFCVLGAGWGLAFSCLSVCLLTLTELPES